MGQQEYDAFREQMKQWMLDNSDIYDEFEEMMNSQSDMGVQQIMAQAMSLTSTEKGYVSTPSIKVYEITNGNLKSLGWFSDEYSTWNSYGAKIGNYSETSHDFSKVNTVRYNLAAEIGKDYINKPLVILTSIDDKTLEDTLTIEDVKNKCVVIKILNRNKL